MPDFPLDSFRPLNGYMTIRMDPESDMTESRLLYKPGGAREHLFHRGTVLRTSMGWTKKVRPGKVDVWRELPCPLEPGTRVLFLFFYGHRTFERFREKIGDRDVIMLKPEDVVLYDDPEREGPGIDDISLSVGRGASKLDTSVEEKGEQTCTS